MRAGILDDPVTHLNDEGMRQAKRAAELLKHTKIDAIYCSDLTRAVQTATEIHHFHTDVPMTKTAMLRERSHGSFEGRVLHGEEEAAYQMARYGIGTMPAGGEQLEDAYDRIYDELSRIFAVHKDDTVLIVAHGGVGMILITIINRIRIDEMRKTVKTPNNAEPMEFDVQELKYMGVRTYKSGKRR
jgi:broad specificity phosphatase PhoE